MNFKFYDVLSHLIPGILVLMSYLVFAGQKFDNDLALPFTAAAFVIGYFVNTLASWLEDFYYFTWGGKPSNKLLDGKDIWKIRFYEHAKAKTHLQDDFGSSLASNDALFSIAMRHANQDKNSRVADFNANYAFSRVILTSVLISVGILSFQYYNTSQFYCISIPSILISWYRCKQRGYYYAKEVLQTYLRENG